MTMFDSNIDYTQFIQFSNTGGLRIATFQEIRDALIKRYKEIYGNDIDTSSVSADGQFLNSVALIINNVCNTFEFAFKQINPNTATGKYLDILCSFNNVYRKTATKSTVTLKIHNSTNVDIIGKNLYFMDKNNNLWTWICPVDADNQPRIIFPAQSETDIEGVECNTNGPVVALGKPLTSWNDVCDADIYEFVNVETGLQMWQEEDAIPGYDEETDESLRSRRYNMLGINSVSILEGLKSALLNLSGIKDVCIINNGTNSTMTAGTDIKAPSNDGTSIDEHSIYIAIRYEDDVNVPEYTIAQTIYNKLTPGISTQESSVSACRKSYTFNIVAGVNYTLNWKKCDVVKPTIVLTYDYTRNYNIPLKEDSVTHEQVPFTTAHQADSDVEKNIVKNLQEFINNQSIESYLQVAQLLSIVQQSDIQVGGLATLFAKSGNINTNEQMFAANLSYFKYDDTNYSFEYNETTHVATLTISAS